MKPHHTKNKGDLGVAKAHADLVGRGFVVLFPTTEHASFDLVAYADGQFHRIQVKYRAARHGAVNVQFRSTWSDRNGTHTEPVDKGSIDLVCIYCPDSDACYYLRPADFAKSVTLRVAPSGNGQHAGVREASAFCDIPSVPLGDEIGNRGSTTCLSSHSPMSGSLVVQDAESVVQVVRNPYLTPSGIAPPSGRRYAEVDRSAEAQAAPGVITADDDVVRAFESIGWEWCGRWSQPDYQHFSAQPRGD